MSVDILLLGICAKNRIRNVPLGVRDDTRARLGKSNGRIFKTDILYRSTEDVLISLN